MPVRKCAPNLPPFFTDLPKRMATAHLVIARSGAGTLAELPAIGRPAILIPLPAAHRRPSDPQCRMSSLMPAQAGACRKSDLTPAIPRRDARTGFSLPDDLAKRAAAARALAKPDAAARLADVIDGLQEAA